MWKSRIKPCWMVGRWVLLLVKSWWRKDRIRVSPREGRLLRLHAPCHLLIRDIPVQVLERKSQPQESDGRLSVVYSCWTSSGPGELLVEPDEFSNAPRIVWRYQGCAESVPEAEIEVFS
jgi:hypothetical protein